MKGVVAGPRLTIFHYHFLPGGVTTVVCQALRAIRSFLPEIGDILLVGGRVPEAVRREAEAAGARTVEFPEIDYRDHRDYRRYLGYLRPRRLSPRRGGLHPVSAEAAALAGRLQAQFGGGLWWVHNHHLGRNPVFTEALLEVLAGNPDQRAVLEIHDFPECGRTANLHRLSRSVRADPYPVGPNVRYAVLGQRDHDVLLQAGLPRQAVHRLPDPVLPAASFPGDRDSLRRCLMAALPDRAADLDPGRRVLLYPVRTIRRKNVLEAALIARLLDASLLVTLPGLSAAERRYSDLVAGAFAQGLCRGAWGVGQRLDFAALPGACDLVLSTSVQEGFGYLFVNALQWGRPLAGRRLETLAGLDPLLEGYPALLYPTLRVPLRRTEAAGLRRAYERKLRRLSWLYDAPTLESLRAGIPAVAGPELAEFSYLPVPLQLKLIRELPQRAAQTRRANAVLLDALEGLTSAVPAPRADAVDAHFGPAAFAGAFAAILGSFRTAQEAAPALSARQQVIRRFARLENLRLLYDY